MVEEQKSQSSPDEAAQPGKKPVGFWKRVQHFFITLALLGGAGVYCLPWIAGYLLREETAQQWISEQFEGNIQIGDASIGWYSPVLLNDVTYSDRQGRKLMEVKAVTSNQSLWDLLRRPNRPVELEFEGMQASFIVPQLEPRGTFGESIDVNKALQQLMTLHMPRVQRELAVRVVESQLELTDSTGNVLNRWSPISGEYHSRPGSEPQQTLVIDAPVAETSQNPLSVPESNRKLHLDARWTGAKSITSAELLTLKLSCTQQPLTGLQPLLEPLLPALFPLDPATVELTGSVSRIGQQGLQVDFTTHSATHPSTTEARSPFSLQFQAAYSEEEDRIEVRQLVAQLDEAAIDLRGEITDVSGNQVVDATGTFQSPAAGLSKLFPEEIKKNVEFKEIQMSDLSLKGPLRPDPNQPFNFVFELSTVVSWNEATAYGLKSKGGKVKLVLLGQQLSLIPVSLPVAGGHVRQLPQFDLSTKPATVSIAKGIILDRIALTDEVCRDWLRFVSPLLADATRPSGMFSLITEAGTFQIEHLSRANLSGQLQIHTAQVRPGPFADEILDLIAAVRVAKPHGTDPKDTILFLEMDEQKVDFQLVDGRVYHAEFRFKIGEFAFTSHGSVGLDESLDLVVSMAFPDQLAERGPILQALKDETLDFKITGTIDEPKIQGDQLKDVGKRIGIKAAGSLLEKILERRQNRELRPKRGR